VELAGFEATLDGEAVRLEWTTATETNNAGFHVERAVTTGGPFEQIGFVEGAGTTSEPQDYRFTDAQLPYEAETLTYRLRQVDLDGAFEYSPEVEVTLATPEAFALQPAFPNPSYGATTLRFALPQAGPARLAVYDVLGRRVRLLEHRDYPAGVHHLRWDGHGAGGVPLASGLYFVRLEAMGQTHVQKVTLVR
jgi:hypothetical protein